MNTLLMVVLLLQSSLLLPPRSLAVNPAAVSQVPAKLQKDYDKLWSRFVSGQADAQLAKDIENFLKKQKNFDPALTIAAYVELYKGNDAVAARKFQQALAANSKNWIAVYYLGELAYAHQDYAQANTFYSLLLSLDKNRTEIEPKREKALLLATENLVRSAAQAEADNRFSDAEQLYRQALSIAPKDPTLHSRFAGLLTKAGKPNEAEGERRIAEELMPHHTFEPSTLTTRGEFAVAMARLIRLLGLSPNDNPRIPATDVVPTNTQYRDVQLVLGYAVMSVHDSGAFDISGELPGREAVGAAERLLKTFQQSQH